VLLFSGNEHKSTEDIIVKKTGVPVLGRINEEPVFDKATIKKYADLLKPAINSL